MDNLINKIVEKTDEKLKEELTNLMNNYSIDTIADTPDYVLGEYLLMCLYNYLIAKNKTDNFFGKRITIDGIEEVKDEFIC